MDGQSRRSRWRLCWRRVQRAPSRAHATHDPQVVARIRRPGRRPGLRPVPAAPATPAAGTASPWRRCWDRSPGTTAATDLHLGPTTFGLAYCDHVVLYRFTPRARAQHRLRDHLAGQRVGEGTDYGAELTWLWDVTTIADKTIIERNQAGGDSRFYVPGRSRRWKILPAVSCSGMPPSCVRRGRRTQIARPTNVVSRRTVLCPRGDRG